MRKKSVLFSSIMLSLISVLFSSCGTVLQVPISYENYYPATTRTPHEPIVIMNNSDFLAQKEANNWTGTGEAHSPISISDYIIEFYNDGITIRNVDLHWAIVNCETGDYDTQYTFSTGIRIINSTNGAIENSVAHMKETGIFIDDSSHISLYQNTVHDCATGVTVSRSRYIVLNENNLSYNDWVGVNLTLTDQCSITENWICFAPNYGIQCLYDDSTYISSNIISSTYLEDEGFDNIGIFSYGSWNLAIWNTSIVECVIGLEMWWVNGSWVWEDFIGECTEYCVYLGDGTYNITVVANLIGPSNGTCAYDAGKNNHWDVPIDEIGNIWSDYCGTGYYHISGPAGSVDHYPFGFTTGPCSTTTTEIVTVDYTTSKDTTTTSSATGPENGEIQTLLLAVSAGSSIVIIIVVILIFRSSKS